MWPKLNKMLVSCIPHLTHAMLLYCHANCASFIMAWLFACRILFLCLCILFMLALVCLVLFESTLSRGYIKKPRSTTQILLSLQLSRQASTTTCLHTYSTYCLYLILASLSRDCIKLNPKYCIAFTFKPHQACSSIPWAITTGVVWAMRVVEQHV